jgi:BRCA1-associated protein
MADRRGVAASFNQFQHHGHPERVRIRPRPVSFGNPALGTYKGYVYTEQRIQKQHQLLSSRNSNKNDATTSFLSHATKPIIEGAIIAERLVAMVNVPPEQVPEGVLNVTRAHQPFLTHVRIVISEGDSSVEEEDEERYYDDAENDAKNVEDDQEQRQFDDNEIKQSAELDLSIAPEISQRSRSYPPYSFRFSVTTDDSDSNSNDQLASTLTVARDPPFVAAMENAASILAADEISSKETASSTIMPTAPAKAHDKKSEMLLLHHQSRTAQDEQQRPNRTYLILFELVSDEAANTFVDDLHGKPFTSLDETQTCSVHHVVALKGEGGVSLMSPFFAPSTNKSSDGLEIVPSTLSASVESGDNGATVAAATLPSVLSKGSSVNSGAEIQNCAVCLDRMDLDSSRPDTCVLTTVCNHTFHLDCLVKWQDSPCPVCRYDHSGLNEALSECHVCGSTEHNYVCLICGVISCGGTTSAVTAMRTPSTSLTSQEGLSYDALIKFPDGLTSDSRLSSSHARQHYDETLHAYALDTETQHVFDFAGQGYVHRLLQNKDDGKLVEVNDPNNTTSQERSLSPGLSDAQEGEVVHRKLEGFASQYYTLLKSQLEQQRIYYEGRLQEIRLEYGRYRRASNNNEARCKKSGSTADLISALKQERNQLAQRLMSLQGRHDKVSEDVVWLKSMNESLEANKEVLKRRVEESQRQRTEARNMIQQSLPLLEEKLSLLMLQLEETTSYQQVEEPRNSLKSDRKPAAKASR